MQAIDLRSDTVTQPGKEMLAVMFAAKVGDDVFAEDPTVNALEEMAAKMFNMEAGLFCPSGTMTNQIAIKLHTQPGDELLCDVNSHIYNYEGGGISFNSAVQAKLLQGEEGRLNATQIENAINGEADWLAPTKLVCLENTINRAGGSFYTKEQIKPIAELCHKKNIPLHLDGARIFNALQVSGDSAADTGKLFDSVSICLSKGLGAPVGSVLLGKKDFIKRGRRIRKVFGGGMRQAGFLAAAGMFALQNNIHRLHEDHKRAGVLGEALKGCNFVESILPVYTNIVIFNLKKEIFSGDAFEKALAEKNIRVAPFGKQTVRMVTHLDFTDSMLEQVLQALKSLSVQH